jgi:hypothetical protein
MGNCGSHLSSLSIAMLLFMSRDNSVLLTSLGDTPKITEIKWGAWWIFYALLYGPSHWMRIFGSWWTRPRLRKLMAPLTLGWIGWRTSIRTLCILSNSKTLWARTFPMSFWLCAGAGAMLYNACKAKILLKSFLSATMAT